MCISLAKRNQIFICWQNCLCSFRTSGCWGEYCKIIYQCSSALFLPCCWSYIFTQKATNVTARGNLTFWLAGTDVEVFRGAIGWVFFQILTSHNFKWCSNRSCPMKMTFWNLKIANGKVSMFLKFPLFLLKAPSNGTLAISSSTEIFSSAVLSLLISPLEAFFILLQCF